MTAPEAFDIENRLAQKDFRNIRSVTSAGEVTRYRIDVIASSAADVVSSAGGWLFDRAMAGWDINLVVPDTAPVRPLQILGIRTGPLDLMSHAVSKWPITQALAVAGDVFDSDAAVRKMVVKALDRGLTEVTLWGTVRPEVAQRADGVQHRLSAAAHAFKAHALVAAALPAGSLAPTEEFRCGSRWYPPFEPDLTPIG